MKDPKTKEQEKNAIKKLILIACIILCLIVLVISMFVFFRKVITDYKSELGYEEIQEVVIDKDENSNEEDEEIVAPFTVDWDYLKSVNPEIVAWIYIPCIECSYPIVQAEYNEKYLHTTAYGEALFAGSIILDCDNSKDFTDPYSVLYGHNMKNGSMFGILWHIPYQDAAADDPYFWVLTPEYTMRYHMFSAFATTPSGDVYNFTLQRNTEFVEWCYKMKSYSYVDFGNFKFNKSSSVVVLSTCGSSSAYRTVVLGVQDAKIANTTSSLVVYK